MRFDSSRGHKRNTVSVVTEFEESKGFMNPPVAGESKTQGRIPHEGTKFYFFMPFYHILKDKYLRVIFVASFLILFFLALVSFIKLQDARPPLVIHFDIYKGIDFFGGKMEIFGIIISSFVILAINFFLADFLYYRQRFLSYLFSFGSLWIMVLILIAVGVIVSIN